MHAFAKHRIDHLSPSSLNLWRDHPGLWTLRYLNNVKDDGNAAMWRGTAVERGFAELLIGGLLDDAKREARVTFELNAQGEASDEVEAERRLIEPMIEVCAKYQTTGIEHRPGTIFHTVNAIQLRIEHWFDSIPIPVIGYVDFAFDEFDLDLKTTKACPSKPRTDHVRQVALYMAARQKRGALLYVTDKRHAYYEISQDDAERALGDLESCAHSLYQFLGKVGDGREAIRCLPFNEDDYRVSHKTKVSYAEIFNAG